MKQNHRTIITSPTEISLCNGLNFLVSQSNCCWAPTNSFTYFEDPYGKMEGYGKGKLDYFPQDIRPYYHFYWFVYKNCFNQEICAFSAIIDVQPEVNPVFINAYSQEEPNVFCSTSLTVQKFPTFCLFLGLVCEGRGCRVVLNSVHTYYTLPYYHFWCFFSSAVPIIQILHLI